MESIYWNIVHFLENISSLLGVSYKTLNIYIYCFFIPLCYIIYLNKKYFKYYLLVFIPMISIYHFLPSREHNSIVIYQKLLDFIHYWERVFNSNYIVTSTIICVFLVPVPLFLIDLYKMRKTRLIIWGVLILIYLLLLVCY